MFVHVVSERGAVYPNPPKNETRLVQVLMFPMGFNLPAPFQQIEEEVDGANSHLEIFV